MEAELVVVGVNHRSAPVELRERLAVASPDVGSVLTRLARQPGVDEVMVLSTCNRVEVLSLVRDADRSIEHLFAFFAEQWPQDAPAVTQHLVVFRGREAIRHVFRVAAALDSLIVGEPQILGQIKQAYRDAVQAGTVGVVLHRCLHKAFAVAKRIRSETGIGSKSVSVSSAAVELASKVFETLEDKAALLIGAGTMGQLAARHLLAHGVRSLMVTNRSFHRALEVAREFRGTALPFEELTRFLHVADVVIGSAAAEDFVLGAPAVREALRNRKFRPMFLIDLGVPRNFDPEIRNVDSVYLFDIDDLAAVAQENREARQREAVKAETIVEAEVAAFVRWLRSLQTVPTIVALRERVEAIRRSEVDKLISSLPSTNPELRQALEGMTRRLVNKILHEPITHLKKDSARHHALYVAAARRLFGMDPEEEEGE